MGKYTDEDGLVKRKDLGAKPLAAAPPVDGLQVAKALYEAPDRAKRAVVRPYLKLLDALKGLRTEAADAAIDQITEVLGRLV